MESKKRVVYKRLSYTPQREKNVRKRQEKDLDSSAYKLTYSKLIACYLLAGLLGTIWETVIIIISTGKFEPRNASFISPFNFVYGFGFVIMVLCLHRLKNPWLIFFFGALLGGAAEYGLSWAEEYGFRSRSWNYEGMFLNIGGRTTVPYMLVWGAACLLVMRFLYPALMRRLDLVPLTLLHAVAAVATLYIAADLALTVTVLVRFSFRRSGRAALTSVGRFIDRRFKETVIRRAFPNMTFL